MKSKIVCIGDSLTEGFGIEKYYRWSDLLSHDMNIEIINSGISGDTTGGMLARFQSMVINKKPSYVIIMGGTNDLSLNLSYELIISNILAMTRHARYNQIVSIIGIPTRMYPMDSLANESIFLDPTSLRDRLEIFRNKLKRFANEDGLLFIDFSVNRTPNLFLEDGLHPNEAGHKVMMENAKLLLKKILMNGQ